MKKITLTLIALAVTGATQAATLDIKGEIQVFGNTVINAEGEVTTQQNNAELVDLAKYFKNPNDDVYLYGEQNQVKHEFNQRFDNGVFVGEEFKADGEVTWSGTWSDWVYENERLVSSLMVSKYGHESYEEAYFVTELGEMSTEVAWQKVNTECINENVNDFSSTEPYAKAYMMEDISRVDIFKQTTTHQCTYTNSYSENYPDYEVASLPMKLPENERVQAGEVTVTKKEMYEVYTILPLYRTKFNNDGISSDDCLVVKETTNWGQRIKTYCSDLGLVTFQSLPVYENVLYKRIAQP